MQATPRSGGGLVVRGETNWGVFHVEWDGEGNLVQERCTLPPGKTPPSGPERWSRREMVWNYLRARASGRHATEEVIARRQESCRTCPSRQPSKKWPGRHFCGSCGCGDRYSALLDGDGQHKLQFTELRCPRKRPGFSNAEES